MKFREFLGDRTGIVLLQMGSAWACFVYLTALGVQPREVALLLITWFGIFCCLDRVFFLQRKKVF